MRLLLAIITAIFTFISTYAQFMTPEPIAPFEGMPNFYGLLYKCRIWILIGIGAIWLFLFVIYEHYFKKSRKTAIRSFLAMISEQTFGRKSSEYRITIFYEKRGFLIFFSHYIPSLFLNVKKHRSLGLYGHCWKSVPSLFRKYYVIFTRFGEPHNDGSSTRFLVPKCKDEVNGLAAYAKMTQVFENVENLPYIKREDIDCKANYSNNTNIARYMDKCHIKDLYTLKSIHRLPRHLYAYPIYKEDNIKPWGIVVIDISENGDILSDQQKSKLADYIAAIELMIKELK